MRRALAPGGRRAPPPRARRSLVVVGPGLVEIAQGAGALVDSRRNPRISRLAPAHSAHSAAPWTRFVAYADGFIISAPRRAAPHRTAPWTRVGACATAPRSGASARRSRVTGSAVQSGGGITSGAQGGRLACRGRRLGGIGRDLPHRPHDLVPLDGHGDLRGRQRRGGQPVVVAWPVTGGQTSLREAVQRTTSFDRRRVLERVGPAAGRRAARASA